MKPEVVSEIKAWVHLEIFPSTKRKFANIRQKNKKIRNRTSDRRKGVKSKFLWKKIKN